MATPALPAKPAKSELRLFGASFRHIIRNPVGNTAIKAEVWFDIPKNTEEILKGEEPGMEPEPWYEALLKTVIDQLPDAYSTKQRKIALTDQTMARVVRWVLNMHGLENATFTIGPALATGNDMNEYPPRALRFSVPRGKEAALEAALHDLSEVSVANGGKGWDPTPPIIKMPSFRDLPPVSPDIYM